MASAADGSFRSRRANPSTSPTERCCNPSHPFATSPFPTHTANLEWSLDVTSSTGFFLLTLLSHFLSSPALEVDDEVRESFMVSNRIGGNHIFLPRISYLSSTDFTAFAIFNDIAPPKGAKRFHVFPLANLIGLPSQVNETSHPQRVTVRSPPSPLAAAPMGNFQQT